jgi:hypothetical protein
MKRFLKEPQPKAGAPVYGRQELIPPSKAGEQTEVDRYKRVSKGKLDINYYKLC